VSSGSESATPRRTQTRVTPATADPADQAADDRQIAMYTSRSCIQRPTSEIVVRYYAPRLVVRLTGKFLCPSYFLGHRCDQVVASGPGAG
jgi:hypothetical protein